MIDGPTQAEIEWNPTAEEWSLADDEMLATLMNPTVDALEAKPDEQERLAQNVICVLAHHLPELAGDLRHAAAWDFAGVVVYHDEEDRRPGGVSDRAALERYLRALWALRHAHAALPPRLRDVAAYDSDADRRSELATLQALRSLPGYKPKTNVRAAGVVWTAREIWAEAKGWNRLENGKDALRRPTSSNAPFAGFLDDLLAALEVEGRTPGDPMSARAAYRAFMAYTENLGGEGRFPGVYGDDEPF